MTGQASLLPAIFGMVGVVVGAIMTGFTNYLLAVRRDKIDRQRSLLARKVEVSTAARLFMAQLVNYRAGIGAAITVQRDQSLLPYEQQYWEENAKILASAVPIVIYQDLVDAHRNAVLAPRIVDIDLEKHAQSIQKAIASLAPYMRDVTDERFPAIMV